MKKIGILLVFSALLVIAACSGIPGVQVANVGGGVLATETRATMPTPWPTRTLAAVVPTVVPTRNSPTRTSTPVPTPTARPTQSAGGNHPVALQPPSLTTSVDPECRTELWLEEAISDTKDVAELIAILDRDYVLNEGGQWSEAGYTVPAGSIFWTDLFQNVASLPRGVAALRVQGGWGVYATDIAFTIPRPNGGGRYMRICEGNLAAAAPIPAVSVATPTASIPYTCISRVDVGVIVGQADYVGAYNAFFEGRGYQFGGSLDKGGTIPSGSFFLGTFGATLPVGVQDLKAAGFLWEVSQDVAAPNGGRWMRICK